MKEKQTVKCPECETDVVIYSKDKDKEPGICSKCELNVEAVYERHRHEQALEQLKKPKKEEKKGTGSPFDFRM